MKFQMKRVALVALAGALTGCVTQMQGIQVSNTIPSDSALAYLQDLDATFNAPPHAVGAPQCVYSENGMAGSAVQFLLVGAASQRRGNVAYDQWRVDEIRMAQGMAGPFYIIFVKSPDGAKCTPLRSTAGTPEAVVMPKIEEALTALVSLGVKYDPNRLGASR